MANQIHLETGYVTLRVPADTPLGTVCVFGANEDELKPWTTADATTNAAAQLFITCGSTLNAPDTHVNAAIVGAKPGSVLALASAGTYAAGAPVYLADNGQISATAGTRQIGNALESVTVASGATALIQIVAHHIKG